MRSDWRSSQTWHDQSHVQRQDSSVTFHWCSDLESYQAYVEAIRNALCFDSSPENVSRQKLVKMEVRRSPARPRLGGATRATGHGWLWSSRNNEPQTMNSSILRAMRDAWSSNWSTIHLLSWRSDRSNPQPFISLGARSSFVRVAGIHSTPSLPCTSQPQTSRSSSCQNINGASTG